jgi:hypothetical protein
MTMLITLTVWETILLWVFGAMIVVAALMGVYLLILMIGFKFLVIPQEERAVIYRFGRFQRLVGPGIVMLTRLEREVQRINVRSEFGEYRTNTYYFINGVPFNYTVSFWRRYDLVAAAQWQHGAAGRVSAVHRRRAPPTPGHQAPRSDVCVCAGDSEKVCCARLIRQRLPPNCCRFCLGCRAATNCWRW